MKDLERRRSLPDNQTNWLTFAAAAHMLGWRSWAFKLYDTFGYAPDFMQDAARDQGIAFDQAGFDEAMAEQKDRARASWKGAAKQTANPAYQQLPKSKFEGYQQTRSDSCEVRAIIKNGQGAKNSKPEKKAKSSSTTRRSMPTPADKSVIAGWFYSDDHNTVVADVMGCYYPIQGVRAHQVVVKAPSTSHKSSRGRGT